MSKAEIKAIRDEVDEEKRKTDIEVMLEEKGRGAAVALTTRWTRHCTSGEKIRRRTMHKSGTRQQRCRTGRSRQKRW
ncbi:MAG: hypothetical protein ACLR78_13910 [Roseburia sp.]